MSPDDESPQERLAEAERRLRDLRSMVANLRAELAVRDQLALVNDVEVHGIDEVPGERLNQVVAIAARMIGVVIKDYDIVYAKRTSRSRPGQPRPIVIRLARPIVRKTILRAAEARQNLAATVGGPKSKVVYKPRLSRYNKRLVRTAAVQLSNQFKFTRISRGKIFVRRDSKSPGIRITTLEDIEAVKSLIVDSSSSDSE